MATKHLVPWWKREKGLAEPSPFAALQKEMNELLENFMGGRMEAGMEEFLPKVDMTESETEVNVSAEVPGMEEKDLDISIGEGVLTIKGEKKHEKEEKAEGSYRLERSYGSFRRDVALPCKVEAEKVKASLAKGVLHVVLPK